MRTGSLPDTFPKQPHFQYAVSYITAEQAMNLIAGVIADIMVQDSGRYALARAPGCEFGFLAALVDVRV
jgi:hypothetical protein